MTLEELGSKFGELTAPGGWRAELERLQRRRERVVESYAGILPDALDALSGEERRRLYGMLRLEVAPTPEGLEIAGALRISGIQMVTLTRNEQVSGSSPLDGSLFYCDLQVKYRVTPRYRHYAGADLLQPDCLRALTIVLAV